MKNKITTMLSVALMLGGIAFAIDYDNLFEAIRDNNIEVVDEITNSDNSVIKTQFLEKGETRERMKQTALHHAVFYGNYEIF